MLKIFDGDTQIFYSESKWLHPIFEFEDFEEQKRLLKDLILGKDNYNSNDFNKNNFIEQIPKPIIVYKDKKYTVYGAGKLY